MPRAVVYARRPAGLPLPRPSEKLEQDLPGGAGTSPAEGDDFSTKLVKYVPAEVLAFFVPMAAAMEGRRGLLIATALLGLVLTPAYLHYNARKLPAPQRPRVHTYVLSALAFAAWACGTSSLRAQLGIDAVVGSFVLGTAVFVLPLVDGLLEGMRRRA